MRNHTNNSIRVRTKAKGFITDLKERMKANAKPATRGRVHQPIEVFSRLHYAGELHDKVDSITASEAPQLDGLSLPESREEHAKRRFTVYRRIMSEAWESASSEVKEHVLSIVEKEREEAAVRKRDADEDEEDEDAKDEERSAESYLE